MQSTAASSSISTLLHTALPSLMSHGIPSSEEASSTPLFTVSIDPPLEPPLEAGFIEPDEAAKVSLDPRN